MIRALLFVAGAIAQQVASPHVEIQDPRVLRAGETFYGTIDDAASIVVVRATGMAARTVDVDLVVERSGTYTLDLHSHAFDAYLLLRSGAEIVAENDDGPLGEHARLVARLEAGVPHVIHVGAQYGGRGPFLLTCAEGEPAPLVGRRLWQARLADARARMERCSKTLGAGHPETQLADALMQLESIPPDMRKGPAFLGVVMRASLAYEQTSRQEKAKSLLYAALSSIEQDARDDAGSFALWTSLGCTLAHYLDGPSEAAEAARLSSLAHEIAALHDVLVDECMVDAAAKAAYLQGDVERALELWRSLVERARGADGLLTEEAVSSLKLIVMGLQVLGRYGDLMAALKEAIAIIERTRGPDDQEVLRLRVHEAILLARFEDVPAARRAVAEALPRAERVLGNDSHTAAELRSILAHLLTREGRLEEARRILTDELERSRRLEASRPRTDLLVDTFKQTFSGLSHGQLSIAFSEPMVSEYPTSQLARTLASVLSAMELHDEAALVYGNFLPPVDQARDLGSYARGRQAEIELLLAAGDAEGAADVLAQLRADLEARLPEEHPQHAELQWLQACLLRQTGDSRAALAELEELERSAAGDPVGHILLWRVLSDEARCHADLGRFEDAITTCLRNEELFQRAFAEHAAFSFGHWMDAGTWAMRLGDMDRAIEYFDVATARLRALAPPTEPTLCRLEMLGAVARVNAERMGEAWLAVERAVGGSLERLRRELPFASSSDRLAHAAMHADLHGTMLALLEKDPTPEREAQAFQWTLAWQGEVARGLAGDRRRSFGAGDAAQQSRFEELRHVQGELARVLEATEELKPADVDALRLRRDRLERELLQAGVELQPPAVPDAAVLCAALPERAAAVVFSVTAPLQLDADHGAEEVSRVTAWVLRADATAPERIELGAAAPIEQAMRMHLAAMTDHERVRGIRPVVTGEGSESRSEPASLSLEDVLWRPVAAELGGIDLLVIVPDGFLGALPFQTIPLSDGSFVVEHLRIVVLDDPMSLASFAAEARPVDAPFLCVADVDYGRKDGEPDRWRRLPGTAREAASVAAVLASARESGVVRELVGSDASEERIAHELSKACVAHLATHGSFAPHIDAFWSQARRMASGAARRDAVERAVATASSPGALCAIVCAGANDPPWDGADGRLTADEVALLDLSRCSLAVLSACETGLGRTSTGQGMTSLRRAFHQAGAASVVSSLWQVDDAATAELMRSFYVHLFERGESRADALRSAQLEMLARARASGEPRPDRWGAFVLSGEWR